MISGEPEACSLTDEVEPAVAGEVTRQGLVSAEVGVQDDRAVALGLPLATGV